MKTSSILGGALTLCMAAVGGAALADYPEKPVTFIVPWPAGRPGGRADADDRG